MDRKRIIQTKYVGPTNYHGSRVSAKDLATGRYMLVSWADESDALTNHESAARMLAARISGSLEPCSAVCPVEPAGYAFVFEWFHASGLGGKQ